MHDQHVSCLEDLHGTLPGSTFTQSLCPVWQMHLPESDKPAGTASRGCLSPYLGSNATKAIQQATRPCIEQGGAANLDAEEAAPQGGLVGMEPGRLVVGGACGAAGGGGS